MHVYYFLLEIINSTRSNICRILTCSTRTVLWILIRIICLPCFEMFPNFSPEIKRCPGGEKWGKSCIWESLEKANMESNYLWKPYLCVVSENILGEGTIRKIWEAVTREWENRRRKLWVTDVKATFPSPFSPQWRERLCEVISFWHVLGKDKQKQSRALNSHRKPLSTHAHHSLCNTQVKAQSPKWLIV